MALATRFGAVRKIERNEPLTDDQLMRVVPSIFAEGGHESRSLRYTYIPTIKVLEGLQKEGFQPFSACQSKCRIEGKADFTKHMLRLRHVDHIMENEAPEIVLINSHDGTSSYQMMAGMFRFICQNGMVVGDVIEDIKVRHSGNIVENVIEGAYTIVDQFDTAKESVERMKSVTLALPEQRALARSSLALKYDNVDEAPITVERLMLPKRYEDKGNNLWNQFNVIQENLVKGGLSGRTKNGRRMTTRPITSIDNSVKLNKALWILADEMAKIKA